MTRRLAMAAALLCLGRPLVAPAAELPAWLKLDGFGTLGAYRADDPVAGVRADARTPTPSLRQWRMDGDSLVAVQLTLDSPGEGRAVLQLIAKDEVPDRLRPRVEWLYAAWDAGPRLQLKLGRTALPVFLNSDTRHIGYVQTAARPVNTVYQLNPITHADGVNALWNEHGPQGELSLEAVLGRARVEVAAGSVDAERAAALVGKWTRRDWTLRMAHAQYRIAARLPAFERLFEQLRSGNTGCSNCAAVLDARGRTQGMGVRSDAVALVYDNGRWALLGEAMRRGSNGLLIPDVRAWYLQASLRLGAVTPYAVIGQQRFTEAPLGLQTDAQAGPAAATANAAFDRYLQSPNDRRIWQLGLRWDWRENMALKLQLESLRHTRESGLGLNSLVSYPFAAPLGGYTDPQWDGQVRVLTLKLDFVF
ncbi:hypothetical protein [Paucibacter soli]|uniref:hypothetical protein n=1 Tax=Paucibacter soli TaxID=3133433 RepID=UPI00309EF862